MSFSLISGMMSKEKVLKEIHERSKSIHLSEVDVQGMIESAKEKSIHR